MLTKRFLAAAVASILTLGVGACGDSTAPQANLTTEQINDMMDALSSAGFGVSALGDRTSASRGMPAVISLNVDQDEPCPVSGTVHVKGSMNINDAGSEFTMNMTETHQNCVATSSTGKTWTFNGKPNVTANFTANYPDPQSPAGTFSGTEKGAIGFSTTGASGQCSIDVSISATTSAQGVTSGNITGTVCGKDVTQSFTQ